MKRHLKNALNKDEPNVSPNNHKSEDKELQIAKRKERELKKLTDCWSSQVDFLDIQNGSESKRSKRTLSSSKNSEFVCYSDDPMKEIDSEVNKRVPNTRSAKKKLSLLSSHGEDYFTSSSVQAKKKSGNDQTEEIVNGIPNCKRELNFNVDTCKQTSWQEYKSLELCDLPIDEIDNNNVKADEKQEQPIRKEEVQLTDDINDFVPVRRKKLRSELSDTELWEGLPMDAKFTRIKARKESERRNSNTSDSSCVGSSISSSQPDVQITQKTCESFNINQECGSSQEESKKSDNYISEVETVIEERFSPLNKKVKVQDTCNVNDEVAEPAMASKNSLLLTRLKAQTPEKYGITISKSKSELFQSLPETASSKKKKQSSVELLSDMRLSKSACTLWVSESRRRFQQQHPNACSKQLDVLMADVWENLPSKQKLVYFSRAKHALEDKKLSCNYMKVKEKETKVITVECFQRMQPDHQDKLLQRKLSEIQKKLPSDQYRIFLNSFHRKYSQLKNKQNDVSYCDDDACNRLARRVLFKWVSKVEGYINTLLEEEEMRERNILIQEYNSVIEKLVNNKHNNEMVYEDVSSENIIDTLNLSNDNVENKSDSPTFKKILGWLEYGSVSGVLEMNIDGGEWLVPNIVNRKNYRSLLMSALTDDIIELKSNCVGQYFEDIEHGRHPSGVESSWEIKREANEYLSNWNLSEYYSHYPEVFLNDILCI